jgi:hypothetical protein
MLLSFSNDLRIRDRRCSGAIIFWLAASGIKLLHYDRSTRRPNIEDKHKAIIPVFAATVFTDIVSANMVGQPVNLNLAFGSDTHRFPLKDDDELLNLPNIKDQSEPRFGFQVVFGQSQIVEGKPVVETLGEIIEYVDGIIKSFATFLGVTS